MKFAELTKDEKDFEDVRKKRAVYDNATIAWKKAIDRIANEKPEDNKEWKMIDKYSSESMFVDLTGLNQQEAIARTCLRIKYEPSKIAERYLKREVKNAVITVPACFNSWQRQTIVYSASLAGLSVRRLMNEPNAAAVAYGTDHTGDENTVLIFDIGAGVLDVSLLTFDDCWKCQPWG